jgi:hypothetical protein
MTKLDRLLSSRDGFDGPATLRNPSILAVGTNGQWLASGCRLPASGRVVAATFAELDERMLAIHEPDVVVSPVVTSRFDCIDIAQALTEIGFRGSYRAVTTGLPNPEIVRREVRALCSGIDFMVITVGTDGLVHL